MLGSLVNKVAGRQVIKKRLQYKHFSVKLAKFLRTPFYHGTHPVAASDFTLCFVYWYPSCKNQSIIIPYDC